MVVARRGGGYGPSIPHGTLVERHGSSISGNMPRKELEGAQLYATTYWHRGVLLASAMQCREAMATVIRDLDLPTISPNVSARLYQHARTKLKDSRADEDHHGWEGAAPHLVRVGLATVTDPVSGTVT
jgi:hypothetical protein